MVVMDMKGITWVGNVYQQFEAMCLEVEEVMYQDTVKYVENQVQNVGASVKRFYSDVIEDLLSPTSLDAEKVLPFCVALERNYDDEVSKKTNASKKKESSKGINQKLNAENVRLDVDNLCRSSGHFAKPGLRSRKRQDHNKFNRLTFDVDQSQQEEKLSSVDSSYESSHPENYMVKESSVTNLSLSEDATNNEIESRSIADLSNDFRSSNEIVLIESVINDRKETEVPKALDNKHDDEEISVPESRNSFDWNLETDFETTIELEPERIEQSDKTKLEETMVVLNEVDLRSLPQTESKKRPYKKKLREALYSRMRLGRKHEYELLALQHGDGKNITVEDSKLPDRDIDETEWELL